MLSQQPVQREAMPRYHLSLNPAQPACHTHQLRSSAYMYHEISVSTTPSCLLPANLNPAELPAAACASSACPLATECQLEVFSPPAGTPAAAAASWPALPPAAGNRCSAGIISSTSQLRKALFCTNYLPCAAPHTSTATAAALTSPYTWTSTQLPAGLPLMLDLTCTSRVRRAHVVYKERCAHSR